MTARSRLVAGLSVAVCTLALTGCQKPTPLVTLVSGGESVHSDAHVFCFEGQSAQAQNCRAPEGKPLTQLEVRPGSQVAIDVSKDLVEAGWVVVLPGDDADPANDRASGMLDKHYFAFQPEFPEGQPLRVEVRMLDDRNTKVPTLGSWQFVLTPG